MKRPLVFALELLAALALATAGAWLADKVGRKVNAKSNADVRSSFALQALVEVERKRLEFEKRRPAPHIAVPPRVLGGADGDDWCSAGRSGVELDRGRVRETCSYGGILWTRMRP